MFHLYTVVMNDGTEYYSVMGASQEDAMRAANGIARCWARTHIAVRATVTGRW